MKHDNDKVITVDENDHILPTGIWNILKTRFNEDDYYVINYIMSKLNGKLPDKYNDMDKLINEKDAYFDDNKSCKKGTEKEMLNVKHKKYYTFKKYGRIMI